jgi:adenylyl cyclase-associated protein
VNSPSNGRNELLASLNQGEAITASLRKVGDEEKTHKNPELRGAGGLVPERPPRRTGGGPTSEAEGQKKPQLVELQVE